MLRNHVFIFEKVLWRTEIGQLDLVVCRQQNVLRFDVQMHDFLLLVHIVKSGYYLLGVLPYFGFRKNQRTRSRWLELLRQFIIVHDLSPASFFHYQVDFIVELIVNDRFQFNDVLMFKLFVNVDFTHRVEECFSILLSHVASSKLLHHQAFSGMVQLAEMDWSVGPLRNRRLVQHRVLVISVPLQIVLAFYTHVCFFCFDEFIRIYAVMDAQFH